MRSAFMCVLLFTPLTQCQDKVSSDNLRQELQGQFRVSAIEKSGEAPNKEFFEQIGTVEIKGDLFTITFQEGKKSESKTATISLDASKTPNEINLTPKDGDKLDQVVHGIIKIDMDVVKICWADSAKSPRPAKFETNKDNKHFMMTLIRIKTKK